MPKFLKEGISQAEKDDADAKVRKILRNAENTSLNSSFLKFDYS